MADIDTIIFDLGGVLIDWNPRYVYKKAFVTKEAVEHFLADICTSEWNEEQDAGRSFEEATSLLISEFPHYTHEISMYYGRWKEMLGGHIEESVQTLSKIRDSGQYKLFALTNWSDESFPLALDIFHFLHWFDGILVSGAEKMKKPDPVIFELILDRYNIDRTKAIFIDDNIKNIHAAEKLGLKSIHFTSPEQLNSELLSLDIGL